MRNIQHNPATKAAVAVGLTFATVTGGFGLVADSADAGTLNPTSNKGELLYDGSLVRVVQIGPTIPLSNYVEALRNRFNAENISNSPLERISQMQDRLEASNTYYQTEDGTVIPALIVDPNGGGYIQNKRILGSGNVLGSVYACGETIIQNLPPTERQEYQRGLIALKNAAQQKASQFGVPISQTPILNEYVRFGTECERQIAAKDNNNTPSNNTSSTNNTANGGAGGQGGDGGNGGNGTGGNAAGTGTGGNAAGTGTGGNATATATGNGAGNFTKVDTSTHIENKPPFIPASPANSGSSGQPVCPNIFTISVNGNSYSMGSMPQTDSFNISIPNIAGVVAGGGFASTSTSCLSPAKQETTDYMSKRSWDLFEQVVKDGLSLPSTLQK